MGLKESKEGKTLFNDHKYNLILDNFISLRKIFDLYVTILHTKI